VTVLEIEPLTDGHQTCSADIQAALMQVGKGEEFDTLLFNPGVYLIDDPHVKNPYSVIGINDGSKVSGSMDGKGSILVKLKLMEDAPIKPFACGVPILGLLSPLGKDSEIGFLEFDGYNLVRSASLQTRHNQLRQVRHRLLDTYSDACTYTSNYSNTTAYSYIFP
jgi:hypothetical protein